MRRILVVCFLCALAACREDESVARYGGAAAEWLLIEIDGMPFTANATLNFLEDGKINGQAPCNTYTGTQEAPYPWFEVEAVSVTRRACAELEAEQVFLRALSEMNLSEVAGDTLILSNDVAREMVFKARD